MDALEQDIFEKVRKVIANQTGVKESSVSLESHFVDDLNADSLDLVEMVMSLEEEFSTDSNKIEIPDEDAEKLQTVKDAVDYLKKWLS